LCVTPVLCDAVLALRQDANAMLGERPREGCLRCGASDPLGIQSQQIAADMQKFFELERALELGAQKVRLDHG